MTGTGEKGGEPLPNYENPPVSEVACGVTFDAISGLTIPHYGLFWEKIKQNYPVAQHAPPISLSPDVVDSTTGLPLPRVWFVARDGEFLVQLQRDRLITNWRKMVKDSVYPGYPAVIERFWSAYDTFRVFLTEQDLGQFIVRNCELVYINFIPQGEGWTTAAEIGELLPDVKWRRTPRFLPQPSVLYWHAEFPLEENGIGLLTIDLKRSLRVEDQTQGLQLEFTVRGLGEDRSDSAIRRWFDLSQEQIVRGFADITEMSVQTGLWKRSDAVHQP
jgi:hypothetical protein